MMSVGALFPQGCVPLESRGGDCTTKKGDKYECSECGLVVLVADSCGCSPCDLICCGVPMKESKKKSEK